MARTFLDEQIKLYSKQIALKQPRVNSNPNPVDWAEKLLNAKLDEWQAEILLTPYSDLLLNCSRQVGKSCIVSLKASYTALYTNRTEAIIAPTLRQSAIIGRRAQNWLEQSGVSFGRQLGDELDDNPAGRKLGMELWLPSGGRLLALPGDRPDLSIRGDVVDDLIVDEASRVKDELITAATPTTATKTDATITYLSTPAGRRGRFWDAWSKQDWWHKVKILATECPRISPDFLAREKKRLGPLFAQEYECEFMDSPNSLFAAFDLDAVFSRPSQIGADITSELTERQPIWT